MPVKIPLQSLPRNVAVQATKHLDSDEDIVWVDAPGFVFSHLLAMSATLLLVAGFAYSAYVVANDRENAAAWHIAFIVALPLWSVFVVHLFRSFRENFIVITTRSALFNTASSVNVVDHRQIRDVTVESPWCSASRLRITTQLDEQFVVVGLRRPGTAKDFLLRAAVVAIPMNTPQKTAQKNERGKQ